MHDRKRASAVPDTPGGDVRQDYDGYDEWKGWSKPFTYTAAEDEYFRYETAGTKISGGALLEIGFGGGNFLAWARAAGAQVMGTELNREMLAAAKEHGVETLPADLSAAAGAHSEQFDTIVAWDVFEHLTLDQVRAGLHAADIMLKPGGHLLLRFPNGQSPFGLLPQYGDVTHITPLSWDRIGQLARTTGLRLVSYRGAYVVRGRPGLRWLLRLVRVALRRLLARILNLIYAAHQPWDAVVVLVLEKRAG